MKKIVLLSTVVSTMLLATNGDVMIGHGPKSTGMAGVGIAVSHGAESALSNAAMIRSVKNSEFTGSATMFAPDVNFASNAGANATPAEQGGAYPNSAPTSFSKSDADFSIIPDFSYATRLNEHTVVGLTIDGTAGLGVDYQGKRSSGAFDMQTALQIAKVGVPIAYTLPNSGLTLAVEPIMQYSTLKMNYMTPMGASSNSEESSVDFGFELGMAYDIGNWTFGAVYQSIIKSNYKGNISNALRDFGIQSITSGDNLDQPAETGVGIAYRKDRSTFGLDYRSIHWRDTKGYEDFGWKDQDVIAVGYRYDAPSWVLRLGYNHGDSPIRERNSQAGGQEGYENAAINFFNLSGFPATVEDHYTIGGDYKLADNLDLSFAFVYSPETTTTFDTTGMTQGMVMQGAMAQGASEADAGAAAAGASGSTASVAHSQKALTLGATYRF
ncbi:MAG TPA: aromatic hydrocarbon degradation protein [Campylobacterales bacterium]|nr:aromatic hydrocarbon degradation protein [Campylobacterales bacterium]HIP41635.1 aromatic hydrocarbon degradation protein [Campylobacterales bacterium]